MNRSVLLRASFAAILCVCSGCLFGVRHSTQTVREKEPLRQVRFESEQAKNLFDAAVSELKAHKETTNLQLSFSILGWRSQGDVLWDNAVFNNAVLACDTNGDNLITVQEAYVYRTRVEREDQTPRAAGQRRPASERS